MTTLDPKVFLPDVDNTLLDNDRSTTALGAAERERFLAAKRVVAQTERGLDAAARAISTKQEVL